MKNTFNKGKALLLGGLLTAVTAMPSFAVGEDIMSDLQTSATACVSAALAAVGVVLLAGIAKPVAMKGYSIVKSVIAKF